MNISEAHTIGTILQGQPDRDAMIKLVAKKVRADTKFVPIQKISWSELKNRRDQIVVVRGDQGSAVIYRDGSSYIIYIPDLMLHDVDNGTDVLNYVKPKVGKIRALWMAQDVSPDDLRRSRGARRISGSDTTMTRNRLADTLINYAPRYLQAAIANLGGMAQQMIRAENYTGARYKLDRMHSLKELLIKLDRPEGVAMPADMKNYFRNALDSAILHAYASERPDRVQLTRGYSGANLTPTDNSDYYSWMMQVLQRRDQTFAMILNYLKQEFLTGKMSS